MPSGHISNEDYHEWLKLTRSPNDKHQDGNDSPGGKSGGRKRDRLHRGSIVSDSAKPPGSS